MADYDYTLVGLTTSEPVVGVSSTQCYTYTVITSFQITPSSILTITFDITGNIVAFSTSNYNFDIMNSYDVEVSDGTTPLINVTSSEIGLLTLTPGVAVSTTEYYTYYPLNPYTPSSIDGTVSLGTTSKELLSIVTDTTRGYSRTRRPKTGQIYPRNKGIYYKVGAGTTLGIFTKTDAGYLRNNRPFSGQTFPGNVS